MLEKSLSTQSSLLGSAFPKPCSSFAPLVRKRRVAYLGYLLIPSTKAQKMLVMTGKGGEGKSRIGLLLKKLFGEASHSESILRIETNRFASANLEYKLVMIDDDLNMVALPETRNIKSIVTAEDRLCIERKNKQAVQGLRYVRFICFGNGNLWLLTMTATASIARTAASHISETAYLRYAIQRMLPTI